MHFYIALKLDIRHSAFRAVRMFPCPQTGIRVAGFDPAVSGALCPHELYISVILFGRFVHYREYAVPARLRHGDEVDLLRYRGYLLRERFSDGQESDDDRNELHIESRNGVAQPDVVSAEHYYERAHYGDDDVKDIAYVLEHGHENVGVCVRRRSMTAQHIVTLVEVLLRRILVAEYLDHLLPVHGLLYVAVHLAESGLLQDIISRRRSAYLRHDEYHDAYDAEHYQQQPQTVYQHYNEQSRQRYYRDYELRQRLTYELAKRVNIVRS